MTPCTTQTNNFAIPTLALDLRGSATEVLWIVDIYPLIMAGLLVPMGVSD